uniref:Uncharacterized protein n=1 Tax=Arundo donax TaxID=35708 RepID=A0A0A8ZJV1_ARUDO
MEGYMPINILIFFSKQKVNTHYSQLKFLDQQNNICRSNF